MTVALRTDYSNVPEILKKCAATIETGSMDARNKKAKLMVVEHEQRSCGTQVNLFDKTSGLSMFLLLLNLLYLYVNKFL
jgi:hypothetical protein